MDWWIYVFVCVWSINDHHSIPISPLLIRYRRFNMETEVNTMIPEEGQLLSEKSIKILRIEDILTHDTVAVVLALSLYILY